MKRNTPLALKQRLTETALELAAAYIENNSLKYNTREHKPEEWAWKLSESNSRLARATKAYEWVANKIAKQSNK